jgi:hypothetical protein
LNIFGASFRSLAAMRFCPAFRSASGVMWQTYQQFFVADGDKVPMTFSRNATAHTVSPRQFNRRNAVQGIMVACSLLYRLDEEARALEVATGV